MHRRYRLQTAAITMCCLLLVSAAAARSLGTEPRRLKIHYEPTWESLSQHGPAPRWYEDAVFGIYFHWGVYSVPAFGGEKYARNMYREKTTSFKHHCENYGHPTKFGYHDFIPLFRGEHWNPQRWAKLFKHAGADFAGSIGEHHDGFAMWDTEYDEYNAMDMGPRRDVVGEMADAVRGQGMKVVTTFHHLRWDYFDDGRRLCPPGVGVNDPRFSGLYGPVHEPGDPKLGTWLIDGLIKDPREHIGDPISEEFREEGYQKFIEVIDKYCPDQLQIDGGTCVRLGEDRLKRMLAHYFNSAEAWGKQVAVSRGYDSHHGYVPSELWGKEVMISRIIPLSCSIQNIERHFPKLTLTQICPDRWQTSTPVPGFGWAYVADEEERTPEEIEESVNSLVDGIVDVKCKNGVTLMGVAPKPDGTLMDAQVTVLEKLGDWMRVNKEALYGTRPRRPCSAGSLRFTCKGRYLYAINLAMTSRQTVIPGVRPIPGTTIQMLGSDEGLSWHQDAENVVIEELPKLLPNGYACVFKIQVEDTAEERR